MNDQTAITVFMYSVLQDHLFQQLSQSNDFKTNIMLSYLFLYMVKYKEETNPLHVYF